MEKDLAAMLAEQERASEALAALPGAHLLLAARPQRGQLLLHRGVHGQLSRLQLHLPPGRVLLRSPDRIPLLFQGTEGGDRPDVI